MDRGYGLVNENSTKRNWQADKWAPMKCGIELYENAHAHVYVYGTKTSHNNNQNK